MDKALKMLDYLLHTKRLYHLVFTHDQLLYVAFKCYRGFRIVCKLYDEVIGNIVLNETYSNICIIFYSDFYIRVINFQFAKNKRRGGVGE